jgi:erythromycin esterase-like protein
VADAVCGKQIVLLGELPSHGEARAFEIKAKVVERLVAECGFETLLFEAPVYDFLGFQMSLQNQGASQSQLNRAIGRFWWTRELTPWRGWLFQQAHGGSLVLGGIDDQVSITSEYARATLPRLVASSSTPEDAVACEGAVTRHLFWQYDAETPFDEDEQALLAGCAREARAALASTDEEVPSPDQVMLDNLSGYVDRQLGGQTSRARDEAMYLNVEWHLARQPQGSKVIVWTSTVHAARTQGELPRNPLGAQLSAGWSSRMATIGFTTLAGQSSMAGQPVRTLEEAPPGSLEALALREVGAWAFLGASELGRIGTVPSRLFGRFAESDWSTFFDGVVVFREEVAPVFDEWK